MPSPIGQSLFDRVCAEVRSFAWRSELHVAEIPAPHRIAPHAIAFEAEVCDSPDNVIGNGRLIILHDPAGVPAWNGTFRFVSLIKAEVEIEMATDPLLAEVSWTWLTDALEDNAAAYHDVSGTVTTQSSRRFGGLAQEFDQADVEIRASWTADIEQSSDVLPQLAGWQALACQTAGLSPLLPGITPITNRLGAL